jgi:hypothetical protein
MSRVSKWQRTTHFPLREFMSSVSSRSVCNDHTPQFGTAREDFWIGMPAVNILNKQLQSDENCGPREWGKK